MTESPSYRGVVVSSLIKLGGIWCCRLNMNTAFPGKPFFEGAKYGGRPRCHFPNIPVAYPSFASALEEVLLRVKCQLGSCD